MRKVVNFNKHTYKYLRITPILGLRNFNNKDLANSINKLLFTLHKVEKITDDDMKFKYIQFNNYANISYILDLSKNDTSFIFKIPEIIYTQFASKLQENFKDALISEVDYKETELQFKKYLAYKNQDPLSIHIDSRQQELINNILENIELLKDKENIKIEMDFQNINKIGKIQFKDYIKETERRIKLGEGVKQNTGIVEAFGSALVNTGIGIVNGLLMSEKKEDNKFIEMAYALTNQEQFKLSKSSITKKTDDIMRVTIKVSSSNRKALESVVNTFSIIEEDNALIGHKTYINNIMSISEVGQLLQVCGNGELMDKYNIIHMKHKQVKLPKELLEGTIRIGTANYKNSNQSVYLSEAGINGCLSCVLCGATGSGKTTLIQNVINDALRTGSSAIFFDFVETCKASNELMSVLPKDKCVVINLAKKVEGLDFNEVIIDDNLTPKEQYAMLKLKANGILSLVDSCNLTNDEELKSQMRKILMSAVLITFSQNRQFRDAINCLQDHKVRKELIDNIPDTLKDKLKDSVSNLKVLDEKSQGNRAITGTKMHLVNSILNRLYALQMNVALEEMLETDSKDNINFIDEMQKGRFIVIQIPDSIACSNAEKDIICSYYFNRVWFALQQRANLMTDSKKVRTLLIVDEIYQLPNTELLFKDRINQVRKYIAKFVVSCHSINQIKNLKSELISADASYVLIAGSDESCVKDLKERFISYSTQDLINLKKYTALCSLKTNSNSYVNCIVKLPPPIKISRNIA